MTLLGAACTSTDEQVGAWPLRGNLTDDHALLDDAKARLGAEGRKPRALLIATRVEGLTLIVAETRREQGSFVALYGRSGTPVGALRLVELGKPTNTSSLSLGIDNAVGAMAFVVPAPNVTRVAIKSGVDADGQPVMVDVPVRDGVAALPLNGQRPANILIDLEISGQEVGAPPELQAFDVDDPVKAEPNFKPGLPAEELPADQRDNAALWSFLGLLGFGLAAVVAASRRRGPWAGSSSTGGRLWVPAAPAAVLLAFSTPLVIWGAFSSMFDLAHSDAAFEAFSFLLQPVPGLLVAAAAVRCSRAVRVETVGQANSRALALSTRIVAYAAAVLALLAAVLSFLVMLGQGG